MDIIEVTQEVTVFEAVTPGQDDEISDTVEEVMPEDEANEPEDDLFWDVTGLEDEELDGEEDGITPDGILMPGTDSTVDVVGVRFRSAGKTYYFSPGDLPVRRGTEVIVETARGMELGVAVSDRMEVEKAKIKPPLRQIIRIADAEDIARHHANIEKEKEAIRVCKDKIREHNLDMKLIDAEFTFDNNKILFYFTADGRIDFRDLVKDLAAIFRTRIELRQIGVRDETRILGGYGICGRPLCCHSYLSDFVPVSIKMAKEQNLSLNPAKISGACGRLMCCLKNEEDTYEELNRVLPHVGDEVESSDGLQGEVESVNILRQTVRILVEVDDEKELHEYPAQELTILRRRRRGQARPKFRRENNDGQQNVRKANPADARKLDGEKRRDQEGEKRRGQEDEKRRPADSEKRRGQEAEKGRAAEGEKRRGAEGEKHRQDNEKRRDADTRRQNRQEENRKKEPKRANERAEQQKGESAKEAAEGTARENAKDNGGRRPGRSRRNNRRDHQGRERRQAGPEAGGGQSGQSS